MTIELQNISKRFGHVKALDKVNLRFGGQKIYGLLGNNGAGKSTMFNIITSRLTASSGEIMLEGHPMFDNDAALNQIYMAGEKNYYPETMRVNEALRWAAKFYTNFDSMIAAKLAERFKLPLNKKIAALSTGYNTIFKVVVALSTNAPVLLLDEPVLGMDAGHRDMFYRILMERYNENPCTIVISTHIIAEVAGLIEHCIIIKDGRIIKDAPCEELLHNGYTVSGPAALLDNYIQGKNILSVSSLGGLKTVCISGPIPNLNDLPVGLELSKLNLQDYFIQLMNDETEVRL